MKELFVQRFDPITVSYAVLSGMQTFSPLLTKKTSLGSHLAHSCSCAAVDILLNLIRLMRWAVSPQKRKLQKLLIRL